MQYTISYLENSFVVVNQVMVFNNICIGMKNSEQYLSDESTNHVPISKVIYKQDNNICFM